MFQQLHKFDHQSITARIKVFDHTAIMKVIHSFVSLRPLDNHAIQYDLLSLLQLLFIVYFSHFNQKVGLVPQYYEVG